MFFSWVATAALSAAAHCLCKAFEGGAAMGRKALR
jgi:hypothetical protein